MSYPLGQPVALQVTITDPDGEPANAGLVTLTVTLPDQTSVTPTVINSAFGTYQVSYVPPTPGRYVYRWVATGVNASATEPVEFVVADPAVFPIATLAEAKATLNDTTGSTVNDAELQQFIDAMSDVVESIVGPVRAQTFTEWHDGGSTKVLLYNRPVLSIAAVVEYQGVQHFNLTEFAPDTPSMDAFGYFPYLDRGVIERVAYGVPTWFSSIPWWTQRTPGWVQSLPSRIGYGHGRVKVTYTAGRTVVPPAIKQATLELVRVNYQQTQLGGLPRFGSDYQADQVGSQRVLGYLVPNRVAEMLAPYRQASGLV